LRSKISIEYWKLNADTNAGGQYIHRITGLRFDSGATPWRFESAHRDRVYFISEFH